MARFTQPLISIMIGLALAIYGLIHSATHFPRPDSLHIFWSSMPALGAVLLFLLGVLAVVSGLMLLSSGAHGMRGATARSRLLTVKDVSPTTMTT